MRAAARAGLRWTGRILLVLLGLVFLLLAVAVLWLRTPAGNAALLARALPWLAPDHGELRVEGLETDLFTRLVLTGVELVDAEGHVLVRVDRAEARFGLGGLPGKRLTVQTVDLTGVRLDLVAPDGPDCRDLAALWDPSEGPDTPWTGIGIDLDVGHVRLQGERVGLCAGDTRVRVADPLVEGALSIVGPVVAWEGVVASGTLTEPAPPGPGPLGIASTGRWDGREVVLDPARVALGPSVLGARGTVGLEGDGRLALQVDVGPIAPAALGVPDLSGAWTARGPLTGSFVAPVVALEVVGPGGRLGVAGGLRLGEETRWELAIDTEDLQLGAVSPRAPPMDLSGRIVAAGAGLSWPDGLDGHVTVQLASRVGPTGDGPARLVAEVDVADGVVRVGSATASTPAGDVVLSGAVDPAAQTWTAVVERSAVRLGALGSLGVDGLAGRVAFRGELAGGFAAAGTRARGTVEATGLALPPDGPAVERVSARLDLELTAEGPVGTIEGTLAGLEAAGERVETGTFTVGARGERYVATVSLQGGGVADTPAWEWLGLEGEVDVARAEIQLRRLHLEPRAGWAWDNLGPVALGWTDDGVEDVRLGLVSGSSRVQVDGDAHLHGTHDLRVRVEELDLARLGALVPALAGVSGVVGGEVHLSGPADAPRLDADLHGVGLGVPDAVHGVALEAAVRAAEGVARIEVDVPGPAGAGPLRVELAVPYTMVGGAPVLAEATPLDGRVLLAPGALDAWQAVLDSDRAGLPTARLGAELTLGGTLRAPTLGIVATGEVPVEGEYVVLDLDATVADGQLLARAVTRLGGQQRAEVTGGAALDLRGLLGLDPVAHPVGELSFDLVPLQLPLAALAPFVALPEGLSGAVVGGLHLGGRPEAPTVEGGLMLLDAHLGELEVSPALLTLLPTEGGYAVEVDLGFADGGRLHLTGTVPFDPAESDPDALLAREGLALRLDEGTVPVEALVPFVPGLAEASGVVRVSGAVNGSLATPDVGVDLTLTDGAFTWYPANVRYEHVNLDVHLTDEEIAIERLDLVTRSLARPPARASRSDEAAPPPNLVGRGTVALDGLRPAAITATLEADQLWVMDLADRTARVTGNLAVSGTVDDPAVRGDIRLVQGRLALDDSFFEGVDAGGLDPDIQVVRSGSTGEDGAADEGDGFTGDLDLRLSLERAAELDVVMPTEDYGGALTRGVSEIRLAVTLGDRDGLIVRARDGTISVVGEVEPIRGTATVLGREFAIAPDGLISFTGLDVTNPILDLEATRDSGGYGTITASITGTASHPSIVLTSDDPRYATTDDAVAILLFGAPLSGDPQAGNLVAMVLGSLMAAQVEEAGQILPVDEVQLTSTGISAGKRIGSRVLITVTFNTSADETKVNLVEVELQVQLPERWFLSVATGTSGFSKAAAFRRWRFGGKGAKK